MHIYGAQQDWIQPQNYIKIFVFLTVALMGMVISYLQYEGEGLLYFSM